MRITEHRMVELSSGHLGKARERVSRSGEQLSSGERVSLPSHDPSAWAAGQRAEADRAVNAGRGEAVARAQERLTETEGALTQIGAALQRGRELAVMASSEVMDANQREVVATEVDALWQAAMAAANTRSRDGEYILAGSRSNQPPFDANGVYQGDGVTRVIETQSGLQQDVSITGEALTATAGVDVLSQLSSLAAALRQNDRAGINAAVDGLDAAHQQVSLARGLGGDRSLALLNAEEVQRDMDDSLEALRSQLIGADPIEVASQLAQQSQALEVAQVVATRIIEITRP